MAEDDAESSPLVRASTHIFGQIEHGVYVALGALLSVAAFLALGNAAYQLWRAFADWAGDESILPVIDRLLFVLLLVEVLHTVRASIRTGGLTPEPFLIVGLIASIRRVLVITLQTSEVTKPGGWTPQSAAIVQGAMLELAVIGVLILVLVVSLYLLGRIAKRISTDVQ